MKKLIIALLLSVPMLAQQSPNTVSYQVLSKSIASSGTVNIPSVYNIGQNSHLLFGYTSDITTSSCSGNGTGFQGAFALQGSIDNVIWNKISTVGNNLILNNTNTSLNAMTALGTGVYPYLRIAWANTTNSTCQFTLWYIGSISPNAYTGTTRVAGDGFLTQYIKNSASGDNDITSCQTGGIANNTFVLYGLYLYNPAAANTIEVGLGLLTGFNPFLYLTTFQQYAQVNLPVTGKPYLVGYLNIYSSSIFNVHLANATEVDGFVVYRCE